MDGSQGDSTSENRRKGSGKRATSQAETAAAGSQPINAPCGACKFLRRKCISGCIFAPHFGTDQGAARFAAVHKVFGASNVSKLLLHIPASRRHDAVVTISYEAQARLSDPVFGCVSTIIALQQQVASLQEELSVVQTQLMNSRLAMVNALNNSPSQQQQHQQHVAVLQPAYSNTSTASTTNNLITINNFSSPNNFEQAIAPSNNFEPIRLCPSGQDEEEEEDEDESRDPVAFTNQIFQ